MADQAIIIRVMSKAGRSRLEMKTSQMISDLTDELSKRLAVEKASLKMFHDQAYKRAFKPREADTLAKAGLKNGDMLFVSNSDTVMAQLPVVKVFKPIDDEAKKKEEEAKKDLPAEPLKDSFGRTLRTVEKVEDTVAKDSYGRVIKTVDHSKDEKPKQVNMIQKGEMKKLSDDDEFFVKHQSFENYLIEKKKKCKDKHLPN